MQRFIPVVLAVLCAVIHTTFAMDCKEVFQRKNEIKDCCSAPPFIDPSGHEECVAKYEAKEKREQFACGAQCYLEGKGLLNGDNEPDKEKFLAKVSSLDGEWKQVATKAVEECFAKHEEMKAKHAGKEPPQMECHPASAMISMCMGKKYMMSCPADQWKDSELCDKVKSGECHPKGKGGRGGPPPE